MGIKGSGGNASFGSAAFGIGGRVGFASVRIVGCRGKFLVEIYLDSNYELECKSDTNIRELRENSEEKKLRSKERERFH